MSTKIKVSPNNLKFRVDELEKEVKDLHHRCAILSLVADILAQRGIVTEGDIDQHVKAITERLQQQTRSKAGIKAEELPGTEGVAGT